MAKKKHNANGNQRTSSNNDIDTNTNHTNVNNEVTDEVVSPLKLFGEAKDRINEVFQKLEDCVGKVTQFYLDTELDEEVLKNVDMNRLAQLNKSIEKIRNVLARNKMKVTFIGLPSNGKSTAINAMLHDKVLPSGSGHTTCCFLQIQGNDENDAYLEVQRKGQANEKMPIQSVANIANSLKAGRLECSNLVKIHWPIAKCPLLKYDVVLVDTPGVDIDENRDQWIDEHCLDSDLFVLVSYAVSTLISAEKKLLHKVNEKLSKPNIFILYNKCDDIEPEDMEQVKEQHIESAIKFLSEELKISSREEAEQRMFYVSARETLQARSPNSISNTYNREGQSERIEGFRHFEQRFEESLSKSAIHTKFKQHTDKGKQTISELTNILNSTRSLVELVTKRKQSEFNNCLERGKSIHNLFYLNEAGLREQICRIKKEIKIMSDTEFGNEIRRLSGIVDEFSLKFSPDLEQLAYYKEELYKHVEEKLSDNLRIRYSNIITKRVDPFNKVMCDIGKLLAEMRQQNIEKFVESQNYVQEDLFDLRHTIIYRRFYADFHEDLEFRFSLGLGSILRKFPFAKRFTINNTLNQSHSQSTTMTADTDFLSVIIRFILNPPQSPATIGSLAVGGILVHYIRSVGLKVILATTVVYGALYAYEYLTWTNSAKERTFKAQYVKYAQKGLQDWVGPTISELIANSVEQSLTTTFAKVKHEVDSEDSEIKTKANLLKVSLEKLQKCENFTRDLLGENNVLMNELVNFAMSFLVA